MTTPLFDAPRFTRNLEMAYEVIYESYHAGHAFEHLNILSLIHEKSQVQDRTSLKKYVNNFHSPKLD